MGRFPFVILVPFIEVLSLSSIQHHRLLSAIPPLYLPNFPLDLVFLPFTVNYPSWVFKT